MTVLFVFCVTSVINSIFILSALALFDQDHSLCLCVTLRLQLIEIYSAWQTGCVKFDRITSRSLNFIYKNSHFLPKNIVDLQSNMTTHW